MNLEFHPAVQREALADRFVDALQSQLKRIADAPEMFSPYPANKKFQRAFIHKFPHVILLRIVGEIPRITVVKHQKQHPKRGLSRW